MAVMYRSLSLENKELLALYGEEHDPYFVRDDDCTSEEYEVDSECSDEGREGTRSSLSLESHRLLGEGRARHVYFSNQEYYQRLEELKRTHLRNMAELERMYISQGKSSCGEEEDRGLGRVKNGEAREPFSLLEESIGLMPARRLQRINSQEELDFHETSSGSDQSELCGRDSLGELELHHPTGTINRDLTFGRDMLLSPEGKTTRKQFRFQPKSAWYTEQSCQIGVKARSNSKVTVPRPFQMMVREEERKRCRVRTRSEVELENTLLRRELEELRECQKKFRASPAPAHIHLPFHKVIRRSARPGVGRGSRSNHDTTAVRPFSFLEREKRKKEAKIVAELGNLGSKQQRQVFRARPIPSSMYNPKLRSDSKTKSHLARDVTLSSLEREATKERSGTSLNSVPDRFHLRSDITDSHDEGSWRSERCPPAKPVKKHIELSIEMVREKEWSYIEAKPLQTTSCNAYPPLQPASQDALQSHHKNNYISV